MIRFGDAYRTLRRTDRHSLPGGAYRREAVRLLDIAGAVIADVGAGDRPAAPMFSKAKVVSIDAAYPAAVRADMAMLPFASDTFDGLLYSASLHYVPLVAGLREAARVLRRRGLLIAVDSPVYRGTAARDSAQQRSAEYFRNQGSPELADHYFPIEEGEFRRVADTFGFRLERLEHASRWWPPGRWPASFIAARKT